MSSGLMIGVEPRFRAGILYVAGFTMERSRPEVDPPTSFRAYTFP